MKSQDKTKNFWSDGFVARLYRKYAGRHFTKMHELLSNAILDNNSKHVLDIACGPGDFLEYLKDRDGSIKITGTDIAPGMVTYAKDKLGDKADIFETDSEKLPFEDGSFDVVTVMMAFHHFPHQLNSLKEIKRVLKSGGNCFIADVMASSKFQKKFWNFFEKLSGVRGYIQHYTEVDLAHLSKKVGYISFTSEYVPGMAKRYKVCRLSKGN